MIKIPFQAQSINSKQKIHKNPTQNIFSILHRQEQNINELLNKYQNINNSIILPNQISSVSARKQKQIVKGNKNQSNLNTIDFVERNKKIQYYLIQRKKNKVKSKEKSKEKSISLPLVERKVLIKSSSKKKRKSRDFYSYENSNVGSRANQFLYKAYNKKEPAIQNERYVKLKKRKSKHKRRKSKKVQPVTPLNTTSVEESNPEFDLGNESEDFKVEEMQEIQSLDSSEYSEQPVQYYEREVYKLLQQQNREQLNYLFFKKNERTTNWSEDLLKMIEKHDKEVTSLRRRTGYLCSFDDKFFARGIFNSD